MYTSAEQMAVQDRRTARSHRFLLRLGILAAAFAAAFMVGTAAAQADEQNVNTDESAAGTQLPAEPSPAEPPAEEPAEQPVEEPVEAPPVDEADGPKDDGIIEDEDGKNPPEQQAPVADLAGAVAVVPEAVADAADVVDEVAGGVGQNGSQAVENTVDAISQGTPPEGLPGDLEDTAHGAVAPLLNLVPDDTIPGHETPGDDVPTDGTPGAVPAFPHAVTGIERGPRAPGFPASTASAPAAAGTLAGGSAATSNRFGPGTGAPADAAATTSSDLGGDSPLTELLGGDHGVVTGGSGAGVADRATPASASYGDHAELVSDPVRTDARPHTAPVARPEFAPD